MVTIGLQGGVKGELNMGVLLAKRLSVFGTALRSRPVDGPGGKGEAVAKALEVTWPLIEAGRIVPIVDSVFGFDDAAAAACAPRQRGCRGEGAAARRCVSVSGWCERVGQPREARVRTRWSTSTGVE